MGSQETSLNWRQIMKYNEGFVMSKVLYTACNLGVFDLLEEENFTLSINEISQKMSTSLHGMQRLLNMCEMMRLVMSEKKDGTVYYQLSEMARHYLTSNSTKSLVPWIKFFSHILYPCAEYSEHAVREGKPQVGKAFGDLNMDYFDIVYRSKEHFFIYQDAMSSTWSIDGEEVVTTFDLSTFKNVYDLGGSTGALAKKLISAYPHANVTVYDLPKVIQAGKKYDKLIKDYRISFQEGDLFNDPIPPADLYIIAHLIHLLSDEKCIELLRKVYAVCKPGGAVLLVESFLKYTSNEIMTADALHFIMALISEGKERTAKEMSLLLEKAGFQDVEPKTTGKLCDLIIGRKALN